MKKSTQRSIVPVALFLWSMLALTENAHAYLDPGTGSYVMQIVMAALLGTAFSVKMYWHRLKGMMSNTPDIEKRS